MAKDLAEAISKQIVHTDSLFSVDDTFNDSRFMRVRVAVMHSGINRNNSRFSLETIKAAKDTFANIPILADIREYEDENGDTHLDYSGHTMHVEEDRFNEDSNKMIYDEKVVGIIPETNDFEIVHDDKTGNDYAMVTGLLFRDYGNYCCDILEARGGMTDVSAEIACDDCSFSAKDKCLDVGTMCMCAVTLLGDAVTPGMQGAHAEVFSSNQEDRQTQLIKIMQELKESLDNYNTAVNTAKDNSMKGGKNQVFEELLEKYEKTVEDITFDYENMSDEELEAAFAEAFAAAEGEPEEDPEPEPTPEENVVCHSIKMGEQVKEYSVSLSDIMFALSQLVNDTYADENSYYGVEVYADEKFVIMQDYWNNKAYKQSYKVKKDSYSLTGDRVPVKSIFVTEDEEKAIDEMRSNYAAISEKLSKYEAEPDKMKVLESEDYKLISEKEEFVSLKEQDKHFDLSVEDVKAKADEILLSYAKQGKLEFAAQEDSPVATVTKKNLPSMNRKQSRYGSVFAK